MHPHLLVSQVYSAVWHATKKEGGDSYQRRAKATAARKKLLVQSSLEISLDSDGFLMLLQFKLQRPAVNFSILRWIIENGYELNPVAQRYFLKS